MRVLVEPERFAGEESELWKLYPAINCDKTQDIPVDYPGPIGVPITYMANYNPERFEIVDNISPVVNGKEKYRRIIIRNKRPEIKGPVDLTEVLEMRHADVLITKDGHIEILVPMSYTYKEVTKAKW